MSDSPLFVLPMAVLIIAASAFFVAVEFALIAARRNRLADLAETKRTAAVALRNSNQLQIMLAGSQLGITICTLALGAIVKPAVHHWLYIPLSAVGLPEIAVDVLSFLLALFVVTFVHLVIGEMAPKSWAIAHPEKVASMLAIPMRIFLWLTAPLLRLLNGFAAWILHRFGVEQRNDTEETQDAEHLRLLVAHSAKSGVLESIYSNQVESALNLQSHTVGSLCAAEPELVMVTESATVAEALGAARESGHLRILIGSERDARGLVHVREMLRTPENVEVRKFVRPLLWLGPETTLAEALTTMRSSRTHMAAVGNSTTGLMDVITMGDILREVLPTETASSAEAYGTVTVASDS